MRACYQSTGVRRHCTALSSMQMTCMMMLPYMIATASYKSLVSTLAGV